MRINESSPRLTLGRPSGPKGRDASTPTPGISSDTLVLSTHASSAAPKIAESLPQPLLSEVGGTSYYVARAKDFQRRHPDLPVPSYYMGYGDKYVHRFTEDLAPKLSPEGQAWLARARVNLQMAFENKLKEDPAAFDRLEQNDAEFMEFAYESHPKAYLEAGMEKLPLKDLVKIGMTPDLRDIMTVNGLEQVADVAAGLAARKARAYLEKGLTWKLPKKNEG
ncbi:MAG TPA: hypothetical protein V6D05_16935 [Stenomitos sp.]